MNQHIVTLAALIVGAQVAFAAKPPTITCPDPGYEPVCVLKATPVPTATKTPAQPTPTRTATPAPTAPPPTIIPPPIDTTAPSVTITYPLSGSTIPPGVGKATADVTDNVGVTKVEFKYHGALRCTDTAPPWECTIDFQPPNFGVGVTAYDSSGNTTYKENNGAVSAGAPTPGPTTAPTAAPTVVPTTAPTAGPSPTAAPTSPPGASVVATPPALPRASVDVTLPVPSGVTRQVQQGGNLQDALDRANPGDVVELAAGATFTGGFRVRAKPATATSSLWTSFKSLFGVTETATAPKIWIRTTAWQQLPPPGTRVTAADAAKMPKLVGPGSNVSPLKFDFGASNYYFTGIEVTTTTSLTSLVEIGTSPDGSGATSLDQLPDQVVFDRVYLHGTSSLNVRRAISAQTRAFAIVDSYIDEIHEAGADSQAIAAWNAAGPHLIRNNFLSGAGENILYGGADASIQNLTPCDLTIVNNVLYKPQSWRTSQWTVKNLFELKHACRTLFDGNTLDGIWTSAQAGYAVQMTPRNQSGSNPWANIVDTTFSHNHIKNAEAGLNYLATDSPNKSGTLTRMSVRDNLIEVNGGRDHQVLGGNIDLSIRHNTMVHTNGHALYFDGSTPNVRFEYVDNVLSGDKNAVWGGNSNIPALFPKYMPGGLYTGNVIYELDDRSYIPYFPAGNFFPATQAEVGFDASYKLSATSPYKGKATDGTNPGYSGTVPLAASTSTEASAAVPFVTYPEERSE